MFFIVQISLTGVMTSSKFDTAHFMQRKSKTHNNSKMIILMRFFMLVNHF